MVDLLEADALRLAKKDKIQIGWASSRVRLRADAKRCFRCLGYGHSQYVCKGPDRSKACLKCGKEGHKRTECGSDKPTTLHDKEGKVLHGALSWRGKLPQLPGGSGCGEKQMSSVMIQFLQGNMNRARGAGDLLEQIAREEDSDILLISEPSYNISRGHWLTDDADCCAIWLRGRVQASLTQQGKGNCHVWDTCGGTAYISCYLSQNDSPEVLATKLPSIESTVRMTNGSVILAGDFNARALEWGMSTTNPRGRMVLEMATRCKLVVQNIGNRPTYERAGWGASIPDITFATEGASRRIGG